MEKIVFEKIRKTQCVRITGLNLDTLKKAVALEDTANVAKDQYGANRFAITIRNGGTVITECSFEIDENDFVEGVLHAEVVGDLNDVLVNAVVYTNQIMGHATLLAEVYDNTLNEIKEI